MFIKYICKMHYLLRLKISAAAAVSNELRSLYEEAVVKHNQKCDANGNSNSNANGIANANETFFDAGFDLFSPVDVEVGGRTTVKINQEVKGEMRFITSSDDSRGVPVGYYMYPRSSTGTKTPLRLANSVGIIDSGYRGNYIAVFDNSSEAMFTVEKMQRLVQICPPNMTYPMRVELVENDADLSMNTGRGEGGFGSTGK
jgi:dUTP pyrophosphatase